MGTQTNAYIQESIQLLNNSGFKQLHDVKVGQDLVGETAVIRPLHIGHSLVSYLIGERANYNALEHRKLSSFKQAIKASFNDSEIKALCFELNIPYENLGATTHDVRIQELIDYGRRHGRLAEMVDYCRRGRPHIAWPDFPLVPSDHIQEKKTLAVVVCINHRVLHLAAAFLAQEQIDSNYLLITTVPDYTAVQWLPPEGKWEQSVRDFYHIMQKAPSIKRHFFIAAPIPYAFAIGSAWSLVNDGDEIYHWDGSKYVHVLTTTRAWKG